MALRLALTSDLPLTPRSGYSRYRPLGRAPLPRLSSYGVMTRRMTLLVLALVGLMVLVVTVSPPDTGVRGGAQETPTPSPRTTDLTDPDAFDVTATLSSAAGEKPKKVEALLGDRVEITVNGTEPDSVELGELHTEPVEAGLPARFVLLADTPGSYPVRLVDEDRQIGTLEIR